MEMGATIAAAFTAPTPQWHAPWKLKAVVSGHLGWVRSIAVDPLNQFVVTGSSDWTIKIWDLPKLCTADQGALKLTLTGGWDIWRWQLPAGAAENAPW